MRRLIPFWFAFALFTAFNAYAEPPELALAGVYDEGVALDDYWVSEKPTAYASWPVNTVSPMRR